MNIFSKKLVKSEELENKIEITCSYNNLKCEFIQGRILSIENNELKKILERLVVCL